MRLPQNLQSKSRGFLAFLLGDLRIFLAVFLLSIIQATAIIAIANIAGSISPKFMLQLATTLFGEFMVTELVGEISLWSPLQPVKSSLIPSCPRNPVRLMEVGVIEIIAREPESYHPAPL